MLHRFGGPSRPTARRHHLVLSISAVLVAVATIAPASTLAADRTGPRLGPALHDGIFRSTCLPSHVAMDDPIVHPGEAGASHQHEFFGNKTTNADSTYANLRAGGTTCRILADTAAY